MDCLIIMEIEFVRLEAPIIFSGPGLGGVSCFDVYLVRSEYRNIVIRPGGYRNKRITKRYLHSRFYGGLTFKNHKSKIKITALLPESTQINKIYWKHWISSKTYKKVIEIWHNDN